MSKFALNDNISKDYRGELEIIIKDSNGNVVNTIREHNLVKIFAKEILGHTMGFSKVWDPDAGSATGAWVSSGVDPNEDFSVKYILLGASFDDDTGEPLNTATPSSGDWRYYSLDSVTGTYVPVKLNVGADNNGGLIHAIPISEPDRPLKRIESISFDSSYQPADSPLLASDVRALDNVVTFETTLTTDEYNGFGTSASDFFTITEVALAAGKTIDTVGSCECTPRILFLDGEDGANDVSIDATATGTTTITLDDASLEDRARIVEGDQIMIVARGDTDSYDFMDQVSPFYLVISKAASGSDIVLDRVPVDSDGNDITGDIGVYRDTLRIFSQRVLSSPFKKSSDFEITIRWSITFA